MGVDLHERGSRCRRLLCLGVECQAEPVGEPGEVIEHPNDVRHLEAGLVIETERAKRLPITFDHPGRSRAELLGQSAESAGAII